MRTRTRCLHLLDSTLSYAIRCWKAGVRLMVASHTAKAPEAQAVVAATIAQANEAADSASEILFEQSKKISEVAREITDEQTLEEVNLMAGSVGTLLDEAAVLTLRAALYHEAMLVIPENYVARKQIEAALKTANKALADASRSLAKTNDRLAAATHQALVAHATVEHDVTIEKAHQIVSVRWQ